MLLPKTRRWSPTWFLARWAMLWVVGLLGWPSVVRAQTCPRGFYDPRNFGECWECPAGFGRTIAPVTASNACEILWPETYAPATRHGEEGCEPGDIPDSIYGGTCWRCPPGLVRTGAAVYSDQACGRPGEVFDPKQPAEFIKYIGCNEGEFPDLGWCWTCPAGSARTVFHVESNEACAVSAWVEARPATFISSVPLEECGSEGQPGCAVGSRHRDVLGGLPCERNLVEIGARCVQCGAEGQVGCPILSPRRADLGDLPCEAQLAEIGGLCSRCGSEGAPGCPVFSPRRLALGDLPCEVHLAEIGGLCVRCGSIGQAGCPILSPRRAELGDLPCELHLAEIGGLCSRCGGEGDAGCPVLSPRRAELGDLPCEVHLAEIAGRCVRCGDAGEPGCPVFSPRRLALGDQPCEPNLREIDFVCQAWIDSSCGQVGQRACCGITLEGANCAPGLIEVAGCAGDCTCGGVNPLSISASGTCHQPSPCGAEGQRACCVAERVEACDAGLREVPSCSGDCFCGASLTGIVDDDPGGTSSGTCTRDPVDSMSQPAIGQLEAEARGTCSQLGYADLHMHLFGEIAHGGGVLAGSACPRSDDIYCPEAFDGQLSPRGSGDTAQCSTEFCAANVDVNDALGACYGSDFALESKTGAPQPEPSCPSWVPDCGSSLFHGNHGLNADDNPVGHGTGDPGFGPNGAPLFNAWPRWSSTTHQQAYYKWLERAWRGGMRLVVQMAVNNTALCVANKRLAGVDCGNSMAFIDQQLQAAYDLENFIDLEVGEGIDRNSGWFRIVKTPAEARAIVADGKMAVVLGVEVDHPFNCTFPSDQCDITDGNIVSCQVTVNAPSCSNPDDASITSTDWVRQQVDYYHDVWGVRHMFPIHNFDNAFGGAAAWSAEVEVGNRWVTGHWYETRDCSSEGYDVKIAPELMLDLMTTWGFGGTGSTPVRPEPASCNAFGLFPLGRVLLERMMTRGMIIDVDHMSALSLTDSIEMAKSFRPGGYPLAASHVLFLELNAAGNRHERMRSAAQVEELRQLGGMLGVMLKDDALDTDRRGARTTLDYVGAGIVDDCRHSSKTFLQALSYAQDRFGVSGFGSDFDGVAGHFGPRFGSAACGGDPIERSAQLRNAERLEYPFALPPFGTFERQVSGYKEFDYNVDGLAHVGLVPDFVADLSVVAEGTSAVESLLTSADAYIRMWELATGESRAACDCTDANDNGVEDCIDSVSGDPNSTSSETSTHFGSEQTSTSAAPTIASPMVTAPEASGSTAAAVGSGTSTALLDADSQNTQTTQDPGATLAHSGDEIHITDASDETGASDKTVGRAETGASDETIGSAETGAPTDDLVTNGVESMVTNGHRDGGFVVTNSNATQTSPAEGPLTERDVSAIGVSGSGAVNTLDAGVAVDGGRGSSDTPTTSTSNHASGCGCTVSQSPSPLSILASAWVLAVWRARRKLAR